jgi:tetratricopeptide (TPR) repeat protein
VRQFVLKSSFAAFMLALMASGSASGEILQIDEETNEAIYESPVTLSGAYLAARHAGAQRKISDAADFYRQALQLEPDNPELLINTFLLELADGRFDSAIELAETLVAAGDNGFSRLVLGVRAMKARQYTLAEKHFEVFTGEPFGQLVQAVLSAWSLQGAGKTEEAIARLDNLEGTENVEIFKHYHKGLILSLAREDKKALEELQKAWLGDSDTLRMTQSFASQLQRDGQNDEAMGVLEGFLASNLDHPYITHDFEQVKNGQKLSPPVTSAQAGAAEVLYGLGSSINRDGGEEIAAIYIQLALYLDPHAELGRMALAGIYEDLEMFERSLQTYDAIGATSILKTQAEIRKGILLERLERQSEADQHMLAVLDAHPDNREAILTYGNILRYREDYAGAEKIYARGIAQIEKPAVEDWILYYNRGITLERIKQWPLAEKDFLQALELYPEQPDVLNYLGYTWVDKGMHLDKAMDMLQKAAELRPTAGHIIDSLGWAYYKLGDYEKAVEQLERAVSLLPAEAVIHDHLGDAYWKVGRTLEARFQWAQARDLDPDNEDFVQAIAEKMDKGLANTHSDSAAKKDEKKSVQPQ